MIIDPKKAAQREANRKAALADLLAALGDGWTINQSVLTHASGAYLVPVMRSYELSVSAWELHTPYVAGSRTLTMYKVKDNGEVAVDKINARVSEQAAKRAAYVVRERERAAAYSAARASEEVNRAAIADFVMQYDATARKEFGAFKIRFPGLAKEVTITPTAAGADVELGLSVDQLKQLLTLVGKGAP